MTLQNKTIRSFTAIFVTVTIFTISDGFAEILCPPSIQIEEGSTAAVSCNSTEKQIIRVYWYKGDTAKTNPILRLENGNPGGTEYGAGHYNISSRGAMIITNATILQEDFYTTFIYFHDGTSESRTIEVNITISPGPSCPLIDACLPCEDCILLRNDTGKLTCTIRGIRPKIYLEWIIKTQRGISIVEHPPVFTKDISSDTWNSSVDISYGVSSCNQEASIQCVAQDRFSLLDHSSSTVRIYTANCTEIITISKKLSNITVIVITAVCVSVGLIALVLTCVTTYQCRRNTVRRKGSVPAVRYEMIPNAIPGIVMQPCSSSETLNKDANELIALLKERYKSRCSVNTLPWGSTIGVANLSAAFCCKITHTNEKISLITMDKMFALNDIKDERRVLITGRARYWETLFTEHFVQQWIDTNENYFILLSICKKEVKAKKKLIDFLTEETSIDSKVLVKGMKSNNCILFLHGLTSVIFDDSEAKVLDSDEISCDETSLVDYTLSDLFTKSSLLHQLHVWIILQNKEIRNGIFSFPSAKVDVSHIDKNQFGEFLETVCKRYVILSRQSCSDGNPSVNGSSVNGDYNNGKSTNEHVTRKTDRQSEGNQRENSNRELKRLPSEAEHTRDKKSFTTEVSFGHIKDLLLHSELYEKFKETPVVLSMIVHTILSKCLSQAIDMKDLTKLTIEEIVCIVVTSLQNAYFEKNKTVEPPKFQESLGKLAMSQISTRKTSVVEKGPISSDCSNDINLGIGMGILQHSIEATDVQMPIKTTGASSSRNVEFSHRYFKCYFAAKYLILHKSCYTETLANHDASQNFPVFKFIIHLAPRPITQSLNTFCKFQKHDGIIKLLYKWENQDGVDKIMQELRGAEIHITSSDRMDENAFVSFCEKCIDMEIKWKSLTIDGSYLLSLVTSLDFPITDTLTFRDMDLLEEEFLKILRWVSKKDITLRFLDCKIPTPSDGFKVETNKIDEFKVKTILQPKETDSTIFSFDYKTAKWTKNQKIPLLTSVLDLSAKLVNLKKEKKSTHDDLGDNHDM